MALGCHCIEEVIESISHEAWCLTRAIQAKLVAARLTVEVLFSYDFHAPITELKCINRVK